MSSEQARTAPDYTYWQNALAGVFGPVHDSDPQPGFYRKRTGRAAGYEPVAIWDRDGKIVATVNGKEADAEAIWTYVCQHPILEEWWRAKMAGQPWPDESAAVTASLAPPPVGHNNPPTDEAEILRGQIDAATAGVADYAEIKDDETASKAQSLRSRLLELSGSADKRREALVRPHLDGQKAVNEKWQPLVKTAKAAADKIRDALGAHETRKARAAEAARLEAENIRIKAERDAVKAAAKGEQAPPLSPAPAAPAPAAQIRGAYGKAASVRMVRMAKIDDQDRVYSAFKTNPEVSALLQKLAQKVLDAGTVVDGVSVVEERRVV